MLRTYQHSGYSISQLFTLALNLHNSQSLEELDGVLPFIEELKDIFGDNPHPLMHMLKITESYKRRELNGYVDVKAYNEDLADLQKGRSEITLQNNVLERVLFTYVKMTAYIFSLGVVLSEYKNIEAHFVINHCFAIIELLCCARGNKNSTPCHFPPHSFTNMQEGICNTLKDSPPDNLFENYLHVMLKIFIKKMLQLRQFLVDVEQNMEEGLNEILQEENIAAFTLQLTRDHINQLDALILRLNLSDFPELRETYNAYIDANKLPGNSATLGCNIISTRVNSNLSLRHVNSAYEAILNRVADYEVMVSSLKLSEINNSYYKLDIDRYFQQLRVLEMDVKLTILSADSFYTEHSGEDRYREILLGLNIVLRVITAIQYYLEPSLSTSVAALEMFNIRGCNLGIIQNDALINLMGLVMLVKLDVALKHVTEDMERLGILINVNQDLKYLCASYSTHPLRLRQFIVDFYLSSLSACRNNTEYAILLEHPLQTKMIELIDSSPNKEMYHFTLINYAKLATAELGSGRFSETFESFDQAYFDKMFLLCKGRIRNLDSIECRINSTVVIYSMKFLEILLNRYQMRGSALENSSSRIMIMVVSQFYEKMDIKLRSLFDKYSPQQLEFALSDLRHPYGSIERLNVANTNPVMSTLIAPAFIRRPDYPAKDNLIKQFGQLAFSLLKVTDVDSLELVMKTVYEHTRNLQSLIPYFTDITTASLTYLVTPYQVDLFLVENELLKTLMILYDKKRLELGCEVNIDTFTDNMSSFFYTISSIKDDTYPLIGILRFYVEITARIIFASFYKNPDSEVELEDYINDVHEILDKLYRYKYLSKFLIYTHTKNIDENCFLELRDSLPILTGYELPTDNTKNFVFQLNNMFLQKIFELRLFLEGKGRDKYKDQLFKIDALLIRLNLSANDFLEYREKYTNHIKVYRDKLLRPEILDFKQLPIVSSVSCLIDNNTSELYINAAINSLNKFFEKCASLFSLLLIVTNKSFNPLPVRVIIESNLENILYNANLLQSQVAAKKMMNMPQYDNMSYSLQMIKNVSNIILSLIDHENKRPYPEELKGHKAETINFHRNVSGPITSALGLILQKNNQISIDVLPATKRAMFIRYLHAEIRALYFKAIANNLFGDNVQKYAVQFTVDYYIACHLYCKNPAEIALLNYNGLFREISSLLAIVENNSVTNFLLLYIHECNEQGIVCNNENTEHFNKFPLKKIVQLLGFCINKFSEVSGYLCRDNSVVYELFFNRSRLLVEYAIFSGDKAIKSKGLSLKILMEDHLKNVDVQLSDILNLISVDKPPHHPIKMLDIDSSFASEVTQKLEPKKKKKKKANRKIIPVEKTDVLSVPPKANVPFTEVKKYFQDDVAAICQFYRNTFDQKDIRNKCHAFLGLAHCLKVVNPLSKRKKLGKFLDTNFDDIKSKCANNFNKMEFNNWLEKCTQLINAWKKTLPVEDPVKTLTGPADSSAQPEKKTLVTNKESKKSVQASKPTFFKPQPNTQVAAFLPKIYISLQPREFELKRIAVKFAINFSTIQSKVINILHEHGKMPIIHGSSVINTMFELPFPDVDLLCFSDGQSLIDLINSHAKDLGLTMLHRNKVKVLLLKFTCKETNQDEQLEVAFIPPSDQSRFQQLYEFSRGFGINWTLYYDPIQGVILDPLRQYYRIKDERILDVSQVLSIDINEYFSKNPDRMLDCICKFITYQKYGLPLKLSEAINHALIANQEALRLPGNKKFTFSRFEKLFLTGKASEAFDFLHHKDFNVLRHLFPMREEKFIHAFQLACQRIDERFAELSAEQRQVYFVTEAFYAYFHDSYKDIKFDNKAHFDAICVNFVSQIKFYLSDDLMNSLQDEWAKGFQIASDVKPGI